MVRDFKAPINVSPLIRFGRYSLLLAGIGYGMTRHSFLQRKEDKSRDERYRLKAERDAKIAEEKKNFAAGISMLYHTLIFLY
ncbi:ATP synthase subunit e, mitochondrial-like [Daktulosphaira vitifoliae]|uniref:ATP synthase subunit e, mitochondrial-like n=1 Tax=Daktulosphaira vitifoliae TaxID=58002 RepID=UPI0021AA66F1|nr:ATP synthase subunit e, mitochondrial-like [Daktulosphaira vitifoliae]